MMILAPHAADLLARLSLHLSWENQSSDAAEEFAGFDVTPLIQELADEQV